MLWCNAHSAPRVMCFAPCVRLCRISTQPHGHTVAIANTGSDSNSNGIFITRSIYRYRDIFSFKHRIHTKPSIFILSPRLFSLSNDFYWCALPQRVFLLLSFALSRRAPTEQSKSFNWRRNKSFRFRAELIAILRGKCFLRFAFI